MSTVTSRSALARISWRLLAALGAELGRLALALGLHALIDRLAVLLRQVGAADAHVDDLNAERLRTRRSSCSRICAISSSRLLRTTSASVASPSTRRSAELSRIDKLRIGALRTDRLIELERIGDAVAREGIDHEPFAGLAERRHCALSWLEAITSCAGDSMSRMRLSI